MQSENIVFERSSNDLAHKHTNKPIAALYALIALSHSCTTANGPNGFSCTSNSNSNNKTQNENGIACNRRYFVQSMRSPSSHSTISSHHHYYHIRTASNSHSANTAACATLPFEFMLFQKFVYFIFCACCRCCCCRSLFLHFLL